jgi:hypothetical protein
VEDPPETPPLVSGKSDDILKVPPPGEIEIAPQDPEVKPEFKPKFA